MQVTEASELGGKLKENLEKLFGLKKDQIPRPSTKEDECNEEFESDLQSQTPSSLGSSQLYSSVVTAFDKITIVAPIDSQETFKDNVNVKRHNSVVEVVGCDTENLEDSQRSCSPSMMDSYSLEAIRQQAEFELSQHSTSQQEASTFSSPRSECEIRGVDEIGFDSGCSMTLLESNRLKRSRSMCSVASDSMEPINLKIQKLLQSSDEFDYYFPSPTPEKELSGSSNLWSQASSCSGLVELSQVSMFSNNGYSGTSSSCFSSSPSLQLNVHISSQSSSAGHCDISTEPLGGTVPSESMSILMDTLSVDPLLTDESSNSSEPGTGLDPEIFRAILDSI